MVPPTSTDSPPVSFSHVHLYVDQLDELKNYKELEKKLNDFADKCESKDISVDEKRATWSSIVGESKTTDEFVAHGRDVVKQLLTGLAFRITAARYNGMITNEKSGPINTNTRSVLLTSTDPNGVQIVVTAIDKDRDANTSDSVFHFDADRVRKFLVSHNQRQGVAVLSFNLENLEEVFLKYKQLHPKLVSHYEEFAEGNGTESCTVKVLEVFAFYKAHSVSEDRNPDQGTVLRFMETPHARSARYPPGLVPQETTFPKKAMPAYSDHWVSNVQSRTEFLDTLNETLGFSPKVDFNAGVVAAGEAQIESTVTGNESSFSTGNKGEALRDQSQVFLPINNALSNVGHVHLFLNEIGQGIQHIASRVENLVGFVQECNDQRKATGEGFTFLNIPRSYYGVLVLADIEKFTGPVAAGAIWSALETSKAIGSEGDVDLNINKENIDELLTKNLTGSDLEAYQQRRGEVQDAILASRYKNLYSLLRDNLSEEKYLGIVRNQVLVDIQGDDLLYQIFTCKVVHREATHEAPFFEFIERVCSERVDEKGQPVKLRSGCGGFGIRNFLTLFLSIEVSKAMNAAFQAKVVGDVSKQKLELTRVSYFTSQLNESNPILTKISDAMTEEGRLRDSLMLTKEGEEKRFILKRIQEAEKCKMEGNDMLMRTSAKYNDLMKALRDPVPR